MDKYETLQKYFGYTAFRPGQEKLIDAQLSGRDALGIMPTGGGKSLCYQVPGLMLPGVTLVISPLISLMKDQVMALKDAGVAGAYINSSLTPAQIRLVYRNIQSGMYKIIYVAPERLLTDGFLEAIQARTVSIVTVDEAHCISQWGQDFRPSYLKIVDFLRLLPRRPVVSAFTATATQRVREDIEAILGLQNPERVVTGFDRPNLRFEVRRPKDKDGELLKLIWDRREKTGIIYCSTRKDVESVCQLLRSRDIGATRYHAGLEEAERHENQEDFIFDRANVMVATNAFGMGIDKSNVSFVIHYSMPQSLEAYYQEAGRAGRDGSEAECILLFAPKDVHTAKWLIEHSSEKSELTEEQEQQRIRQDLIRLDKMVDYCKTDQCLRGKILDYFGQAHAPRCGNCGNCDEGLTRVDITNEARIILSCVENLFTRLGYSLGQSMVAAVLRGSASQRVLQLKLEHLSDYGALQRRKEADVRMYIDTLIGQGCLKVDPEHGGLLLTAKADQVLSGEQVFMLTREKKERKAPAPKPVAPSGLLEELKKLRWDIAKRTGQPAYIIFTNASLEDMARKMPTTREKFLEVSGVGSSKAERYGEEFLDCIQAYLEEHGGN